MMTTITLLHTSDAHVPTFKALQARLAPESTLQQIVRSDWLERARNHGLNTALRAEISETVEAAEGTVLCTCTTIGTAATDAGAIRIDAPMMTEAAKIGGSMILAYALESTRDTSTELLRGALLAEGRDVNIRQVFCGQAWPLFEAGKPEAFAASIAQSVRDEIAQNPATCIVLAQASMAGAAAHLSELGVPVLTSPESAMRYALGNAAS